MPTKQEVITDLYKQMTNVEDLMTNYLGEDDSS